MGDEETGRWWWGPVHVFACFIVVVFSGVGGLAKRSYETMLAVQLCMGGEN